EGLAHAHERGIVHRDLKPANVLLTDDGLPLLLDFNLAEDVKARGGAERASIGGTLPYMSPEHIDAFSGAGPRTVDARTDLFSLGVILFELLTGRHPYPIHKKKVREAIPAMVADRRRPPPSLRDLNPAVSPATASIIRKCLAGNPDERYQKAEHLREDLNRQLSGQPLRHAGNPSRREHFKKWAKRHPRLASSGTVAAVAMLLLLSVGAGAVYSRERAHDLQAHAQFVDHGRAFDDAQLFFDDRNQSRARLSESLDQLRGVLARYGINEVNSDEWLADDAVRRLPAGERDRLRGDIGETFYLMAEVALLQASAEPLSPERERFLGDAERWHASAERLAADRVPRALRSQGETLAAWKEGRQELPRSTDFEIATMNAPRDLYLLGARFTQNGEHARSREFLEKATQLDPHNFSAWFVRGTMHLALSQPELAVAAFTGCLALRDDFAPAWLNRGRAFSALRFHKLAVPDYDRAIELKPDWSEAYIQRAQARAALGDAINAEADYTMALNTGGAPVRVYFLRADARRRLGRAKEADADRTAGMKLTPNDELSWIGRAEMRVASNPTGALEDVEQALKLNPFSVFGFQMKAHILAERLKKPEEAITVLDRGVKLHPDHVPLRAGRGVLLARAGKHTAAIRDAREALRRDSRPPNLYQVGCIYALTAASHPEDKPEAIALLWAGLKTGFGMDFVDTDTDLDGLRKDRSFREMLADAKALEAARKKK
ncbi:MAG TPA: protein kinase, partial [Urbifossiella sp.]|nr:protein kinase [Urbifossiella sp.]